MDGSYLHLVVFYLEEYQAACSLLRLRGCSDRILIVIAGYIGGRSSDLRGEVALLLLPVQVVCADDEEVWMSW